MMSCDQRKTADNPKSTFKLCAIFFGGTIFCAFSIAIFLSVIRNLLLCALFRLSAIIGIRQYGRTFCIPLLALLLAACSPLDTQYEEAFKWKLGLFLHLQENLSKPVAARIQKMPTNLLKATQDYEKSLGISHAEFYRARTPTGDELALFKSYFDLLPPALRHVFAKKLLAVFLIDGFSGAGLANWVVDSEGHTYYYIILNSALFTSPLDDWLTYKNDSQFDRTSLLPTIRVRTQTNYKALLYGLLHEGAHIVDIDLNITPYFDQYHRRLIGRDQEASKFTGKVWARWLQPMEQYDFIHRGDLNPYGTFTKKGNIRRSELPEMFLGLAGTPFVSFYSGTSWNEDLADYLAFYHIEKKLGGEISVELLHADNIIDRYMPIKSFLVGQREKFIQVFYE